MARASGHPGSPVGPSAPMGSRPGNAWSERRITTSEIDPQIRSESAIWLLTWPFWPTRTRAPNIKSLLADPASAS
jgi:hypothetical protein